MTKQGFVVCALGSNALHVFEPRVDVVDVVIIDVIKKESIIYIYILQIKRRCQMSVVETTFEPWHLL